MTDCLNDKGEIIVGSEATGTIFLEDEKGLPFSLAPYDGGNLVFCNEAGTRTVVPLTIPGSNPDKGQIPYTIPAVDTADADCKWKSADVELTIAAVTSKVIPLNDKFEIIERNCPPIIP